MESKAPADVGKIEIGLIRRVEQQNREKWERLRKITRKNNWTGWGLMGIVFSICEYDLCVQTLIRV